MRVFLFILLFICAVFVVSVLPRPAIDRDDGRMLLMEPYFLRAISGFGRCAVSDFVWMKSRLIDEIRYGENVDFDTYMKVFSAQTILDPQFIIPAKYAATYLASLPKRADLGLKLIDLSESLNRDRFDLLIIEALIRINYEVPNSSDRLFELAKKIEALPDQGDKRKLVGMMRADDFMIELIAYARTKDGKAQLVEDDLTELWCMTDNADRRGAIESELARVRSEAGAAVLDQAELRGRCRAAAVAE